jgi:hypothetical protein
MTGLPRTRHAMNIRAMVDRTALVEAARRWLRGEPVSQPRIRLLWLGLQAVSLLAVVPYVLKTISPITHDPKPAALADGPGDVRYGLSEATRREIFKEIAAAEPGQRQEGVSAFPTQPWSQEDHRAAFERNALRAMAPNRHLNLTQVYLVMDEGVRARWPGPDGKPLVATTIPLDPRRK